VSESVCLDLWISCVSVSELRVNVCDVRVPMC